MTVTESSNQGLLQRIRSRFHPLWKLRRTKWFQGFQRRFDFVSFVRLKNTSCRMAVHFLRDMPWLLGRTIAEPEVQSALTKINQLLHPKVFWDIGANLGYYSWILLAENENLAVRLFEPDPTNQGLINKTMKRNHFDQAELDPRAITDSTGETTFLIDEQSGAAGQFAHLYESAGDASIAKSYALSKTIRVETTTLDDVIENGAKPPALIKIDVEEAENLVLNGGAYLLKKHRPIIVMESFEEGPLKNLESKDYTCYSLDENRNFLCVPNPMDDRVQSIIKQIKVRGSD
jgi:FkbM family methyltransferase